MLLEWTNLFKHFGKALAMAFGDITDKGNTVLNNQINYIANGIVEEGSP